jgi:hypothetical protein
MSDFEFTVERRNEQGQAEAWLATAGNIGDARNLFRTMAALHPGQWITLRQRTYMIASTRQGPAPAARCPDGFSAWRAGGRAASTGIEAQLLAIGAGRHSIRPLARTWSEPYE